MTRTRYALGALAGIVSICVTACATVSPNVPVRGDPNTIRKLVGSWEGEYSGATTGRSGTISFTLKADTDTAQGEIIMIPRNDRDGLNLPPNDVLRQRAVPASLLTIRFVAAEDNEVVGVLDPYPDPECGCTLITRFYGRLRGDEIKGTFTSNGSEIFHNATQGTWSVRRVATVRNADPTLSRR